MVTFSLLIPTLFVFFSIVLSFLFRRRLSFHLPPPGSFDNSYNPCENVKQILPRRDSAEDFRTIMKRAGEELGIKLGSRELDLFTIYRDEILLWNRTVNLVSIRSPFDFPIKHMADSLSLKRFINPGSALLDIGTGAGLPGIPLKIAIPSIGLTLVEATRRKASFLKEAVRKLGINAHILNSRIDDLKTCEFQSKFDVVVSRAGLRLDELLQTGSFFIGRGGIIIAMKGGKSEEESSLSRGFLDSIGIGLQEIFSLNLPITGDSRKLIIYSRSLNIIKTAETYTFANPGFCATLAANCAPVSCRNS